MSKALKGINSINQKIKNFKVNNCGDPREGGKLGGSLAPAEPTRLCALLN